MPFPFDFTFDIVVRDTAGVDYLFVENKDVFGLTVRAQVNNLLNARHRFERTVYDGRRLRDPVLYRQSNNQLIGPIFELLVKGNF